MRTRQSPAALALSILALTAGCDTGNPAAPSVTFMAPAAQSPQGGTAFNYTEQPITLTITNAPRTGPATVVYEVDVAAVETFAAMVFSRSDIPEGGDGVTTVTLPQLEGNHTYYWRSRAVVDGVAGVASPVVAFFVRPALVFQAPVPLAPGDGAPVFTERPTFVVQNAARTGTAVAVSYEFQVSDSSSFSSVMTSGSAAEQSGETSWTPSVDLPLGTLYWRARAMDVPSNVTGGYSDARSFDRRPSTGDQIDLRNVTIVQGPSNIANWPATARVTSAVATPGEVCVDHTHMGSWPGTIFFDEPGVLVQGNQWMFAFINGRWYGGSGRWYRPGQACKGINNDPFSGTFYMPGNAPLNGYEPRAGDLIGLMSSTPNRFYPSMATVDQRSNVVVVRWGG